MKMNILKSLVVVVGVVFLSACNTVADTARGTAEGMSKDIKAVSNTVNPPAHRKQASKKVTKVTTVKTTPAAEAPAVTTTTETN